MKFNRIVQTHSSIVIFVDLRKCCAKSFQICTMSFDGWGRQVQQIRREIELRIIPLHWTQLVNMSDTLNLRYSSFFNEPKIKMTISSPTDYLLVRCKILTVFFPYQRRRVVCRGRSGYFAFGSFQKKRKTFQEVILFCKIMF